MRLAPLLMAAAPLWAQTRAAAPAEAPAAVPGAVAVRTVAASPAPLSAPSVLPSLTLPVAPAAPAPHGAAPGAAAKAAAVSLAAPPAAAALPSPSVPTAPAAPATPAAAAPAPREAAGADPFAGGAQGAPSPLADFFAAAAQGAEASPGGPDGAQAGRVFDGSAVRRAADMAPTGVIPELDYRQLGSLNVDWVDLEERRDEYRNLRFILTSDPAQLQVMRNFLRQEPDGMNSALRPMFLALRSVTETKGMDPAVRMKAVAGLLYRYYNLLRPLVDDPTMPEKVRARAADVITTFLSEWRVATELLRGAEVRRALERLEALEGQARALELRGPAPAAAAAGAVRVEPAAVEVERGWEVLPPRTERVTSDEVRQSLLGLDGLKARLDKIGFFLERLLSRHRLAAEKGMRPAFVEARRREVLEYLRETVTPVRRMTESSLPRYTEMTLGRTWLGIDQRRRPAHVWVPDHPGLTMVESPDGVVVRALFESSIPDEKTLAAFKRSIESHWTGTFEAGGSRKTFRVEVEVRRIAPGAPYSPDALRLKESGYAHALPDTIALTRSWEFDAAAHEFGHIMGLPDEYIEYYAPRQRLNVSRFNPGSLMSGHDTGVVQPRHLKAAYDLLSVNSRAVR